MTETASDIKGQLKDWRYSVDGEGIAWAIFDREGESANSLGRRSIEELSAIIDRVGRHWRFGQSRGQRFVFRASPGHGSRPQGYLVRHAVKPTREFVGGLHAFGFAGEYDERRLEGIVREVPIRNHTSADAQNEWPVSPYEFGESRIVAIADEPVE